MNRSLFIALLFLLGLTACDTPRTGQHIGTWWLLQDNGDTTFITLDEEGYYTLQTGKSIMLGKGVQLTGEDPSDCKYEIDYSVDPIAFDLFEHKNGEKFQMGKGILRFPSDNSMELEIGSTEAPRATSFGANDPSMSTIYQRKI